EIFGIRSKSKRRAMLTFLQNLGIEGVNAGVFCGEWRGGGPELEKISPIDGRPIARVREGTRDDYDAALTRAQEAFLEWRAVPAPVRGEMIRRFGNALRDSKADLARL